MHINFFWDHGPLDFTQVIRPRRAKNNVGEWRIIVNDVIAENKAGERFSLTQTARIERCAGHGDPCPIVPGKKVFVLSLHLFSSLTLENESIIKLK